MSRLEIDGRLALPGFRLRLALDTEVSGVTALFGPSGSGKTTLLRVLAGLAPLDQGHIRWGGEIWQDSGRGLHRRPGERGVGLVFQQAALFPHLTVRSNLLYGYRRTPKAQRRFHPEAVIEALDLGPLLERAPTSLSGGEQRRVAIGRALLASPELLLMDEPLSGLDRARRHEILPFLDRLPRQFELPVLYVSHAIEEVLRLAERLILLDGGEIVGAGELTALANDPRYWRHTGWLDAGAVFRAQVESHDDAYGLTRLAFPGGVLHTARLAAPVGAPVTVRVRSRDVALSLARPEGTSVLNMLPARVERIEQDQAPQAHVLLDVGVPLWARVMRRSVAELGLRPGQEIFALIKAVAVDHG